MVHNQGDAIGVLVGAPKPYVLPHQFSMKLQPFAVYLMMKLKIVPLAVEVSGNQVMDLMVCCTELVKVPLFSAVMMVKLLLSLERYSEFLLLIKVCILCVLSLSAL